MTDCSHVLIFIRISWFPKIWMLSLLSAEDRRTESSFSRMRLALCNLKYKNSMDLMFWMKKNPQDGNRACYSGALTPYPA